MSDAKVVTLLGLQLQKDWDPEKFISDMYDSWIAAVQLPAPVSEEGKKLYKKWNVGSTFEQWLEASLKATKRKTVTAKEKFDRKEIEACDYNVFQELQEMIIEAIKKYLEKSELKKLIGV